MHDTSQAASMWHFISEHISEATNKPFICQRTSAVSGGDTHTSYVMQSDSQRYFVKLRPGSGPNQLSHEAEGLNAIERTNSITSPGVICHGTTEKRGEQCEYLVLRHLNFVKPDTNGWLMFADALAAMHEAPQDTLFGWSRDNFIGLTEQANRQHNNWADFFAECRIGAMLEKLATTSAPLGKIDNIVDSVKRMLVDHHPTPSLLHGDLWSGNIGFISKGPVIFDPAVYVGDRETDIAMTEMFGRLPETFYQRYSTHYSLDNGYARRRSLYQLYHLLNHALLFGGHYLPAAKSAIIDIQKESKA